MRGAGVFVIVAVVGASGCFSTVRYDDAHRQRVASIDARYADASRRVDAQYASLLAALEPLRASLVPVTPGGRAPVLAPLKARSHDREILRFLDEETRAIEEHRAQAHRRLAQQREAEIHASEQQRTAEIASGRAAHRARLQAADDAFTAMGPGAIRARQRCLGTSDDPLLRRVADCPTGGWIAPPPADPPAAAR